MNHFWPTHGLTWGRRVAVNWISCTHVHFSCSGVSIFTSLCILAQHCNLNLSSVLGGEQMCCNLPETWLVDYSKWNRQLSWNLSCRRVQGGHILIKQHLAKWGTKDLGKRGTKGREKVFRLLLQNADCCRIRLLVRNQSVMQRTVCSGCTFHCVTKPFQATGEVHLNKRRLFGCENPIIRNPNSVEFQKD